jgi:hypothetical protein
MENGGTSPRSEASPLGERFSLDEVINGLALDLAAVRSGSMTVDAARANAELAKQLFNGVRLVVNAQKYLEQRAIPFSPRTPQPNPDGGSE